MEMPGCVTQPAGLDCCDAVPLAFGDNGQSFKMKNSDNTAVLVAFDYTVLSPPRLRRDRRASDPPQICSSWPRLHILYCVYLD